MSNDINSKEDTLFVDLDCWETVKAMLSGEKVFGRFKLSERLIWIEPNTLYPETKLNFTFCLDYKSARRDDSLYVAYVLDDYMDDEIAWFENFLRFSGLRVHAGAPSRLMDAENFDDPDAFRGIIEWHSEKYAEDAAARAERERVSAEA